MGFPGGTARGRPMCFELHGSAFQGRLVFFTLGTLHSGHEWVNGWMGSTGWFLVVLLAVHHHPAGQQGDAQAVHHFWW